jgi:hypothetical protein
MKSKEITIYFHIGQSKTGSSAIQSFMGTNRETLAKHHDVLYPNFRAENILEKGFDNHIHFFNNVPDSFDFDEVSSRFIKGVEFCRRNNISKIVVSSEALFQGSLQQKIKQIVEATDCRIKIILYLRRQDFHLESSWKQWGVKNPNLKSIEDILVRESYDWSVPLKKWLEVFPKQDIDLRPFEKNFIGEDVVLDFLKVIGVQNKKDLERPPKNNSNINPGFSHEVVEFLKYCQDTFADQHDNRLFNLLFESLPKKYIKQSPFASYHILSPKKKYEILERCNDSNKQIAKMFFGNNRENLFLDPWPNPDDPWEPRPEITLKDVVPILVSTILKLDERVKAMEKSMVDVNSIKAALIANNLMPGPESSFEYPVSPEELKASMSNFRFIEHVKYTDTGFEFVSTGHDPGFILSYEKLNKEITALGIEIMAPQPTSFQLFYPNSTNGKYSERDSVMWEINDEFSKNVFVIHPGNKHHYVRIDPGACKGKFIISRIWYLLRGKV